MGEPTLLPLKQICQRLVESPEVGDIEIVVGNTEFLTTGEHGVFESHAYLVPNLVIGFGP